MRFKLRDTRYLENRLIFDEPSHKYTDTNNNSYVSTTTILHNYQPKFDKQYWLRKKARELKISEKELESRWDNITKEACDRGTKTHNNLEDGVNGVSMFKKAIKYANLNNNTMITVADLPNIDMNIKPIDVKEFIQLTGNKYPKVYELFENLTNQGYKIYAEIGAFLMDFLLSGTIDILCIRETDFIIGDWKTNRGGLKFEAGYYKKDKSTKPAQMTNNWVSKSEKLLAPVSHLDNCNGNIYNLQLSMYAYYVEFILGIPCRGLWLCHIDSDFILNDYGMPRQFPDGSYKIKDNPIETDTIHRMPYLKREIMDILKDRLMVVNAERVSNFNNKTLFE